MITSAITDNVNILEKIIALEDIAIPYISHKVSDNATIMNVGNEIPSCRSCFHTSTIWGPQAKTPIMPAATPITSITKDGI